MSRKAILLNDDSIFTVGKTGAEISIYSLEEIQHNPNIGQDSINGAIDIIDTDEDIVGFAFISGFHNKVVQMYEDEVEFID